MTKKRCEDCGDFLSEGAEGPLCAAHPAIGAVRERVLTLVYLTVYTVHQRYGGPEEGGWYYDEWVTEGVSFPFHAYVQMVFGKREDVDGGSTRLYDWRVDDSEAHEPAEVGQMAVGLMDRVQAHFINLYGSDCEASHRSRGVKYIVESRIGSRCKPRPQYE